LLVTNFDLLFSFLAWINSYHENVFPFDIIETDQLDEMTKNKV
jgi:hypothetical protein